MGTTELGGKICALWKIAVPDWRAVWGLQPQGVGCTFGHLQVQCCEVGVRSARTGAWFKGYGQAAVNAAPATELLTCSCCGMQDLLAVETEDPVRSRRQQHHRNGASVMP
jgi:hypothetical protein